jgi:hypothetical protein
MKPVHPLLQRFWAVVNERGEVCPYSIRHKRTWALVAFRAYSDYGMWREARAKGFRLVRVQVKII